MSDSLNQGNFEKHVSQKTSHSGMFATAQLAKYLKWIIAISKFFYFEFLDN